MEVNNELSEKALHDNKTMCRAIDGDKEAYEELFNKHKELVYLVVLKIVQNKSDAKALMIEVFEKSFKLLKDYPTQFYFNIWLFKITIDIVTEFLKDRGD